MKPGPGEWFIITSGEHEGRPHLVGWYLTAIKTEPTGQHDDGWLGLAVCPRCAVLVRNDAATTSGDMWRHEQWHADTDHPIPTELETPHD